MARTVFSPTVRAARTVRSGLLTTSVRAEGNRSVVVLWGEADLSTRPALSDVLFLVIAERAGDVVIDLAEAEFIDSATARTLAAAQQLLDGQGRKLALRSPSRLAARVLEVFGLTHLIETRKAPNRLVGRAGRVGGLARDSVGRDRLRLVVPPDFYPGPMPAPADTLSNTAIRVRIDRRAPPRSEADPSRDERSQLCTSD